MKISFRHPSLKHHLKGFTLIELLVVIAIISILSTLFVGASTKALRSARTVKTTSNLRQIGIAMQMYGLDHDERLPGPLVGAVYNYGRAVPQPNDVPHLGAYLAPYLGATTNSTSGPAYKYRLKILQCPMLSSKAQHDFLTANYVTLDFPATVQKRFGEYGGRTFAEAAAKPNQPMGMYNLTDKARRTPILCTADKQSWPSSSNGLLPDKGAVDGKRMFLFVDGSQAVSDNLGLWER